MPNTRSFRSSFYDKEEAKVESKLGLPSGILRSIRVNGERSNADQVSSAGARTVYQIIDSTRNGLRKNYGVDAYASPENAVLAAGHLLRENLTRYGGNVAKAVAAYHGGHNPAAHGPVNRAYVARVTGNPLGEAAGNFDATMAYPGNSSPVEDLPLGSWNDVSPNSVWNDDMEMQGKLTKQARTEEAATRKKESKMDVLAAVLGHPPVLSVAERDRTPDLTEVDVRQRAAVEAQKKADSISMWDRFSAAWVEDNPITQVLRSIDEDSAQTDPKWAKTLNDNWDKLMPASLTEAEQNRLLGTTSADDYAVTLQHIKDSREHEETIYAGGSMTKGTIARVGAAIADPVALLAGAGVGKVLELAKVAQSSRIGAAMLEGAAGNLAITGGLDLIGQQDQTTEDYLTSAAAGLTLGAAMHGLGRAFRRPTPTEEAINAIRREESRAEQATALAAAEKAGAPIESEAAQAQLAKDRRGQTIRDVSAALGGSDDSRRLLPDDPENWRTGDKKTRGKVITEEGLAGLDPAAEQALGAEMAERANDIVEAANLPDKIGSQFLKAADSATGGAVGESASTILLQSESNAARAASILLAENPAGWGGRGRSAAISAATRFKAYMANLFGYNDLQAKWMSGKGIGVIRGAFTREGSAFDREVFYELEARANGSTYIPNSSRYVVEAANKVERLFGMAGRDAKDAGILGHSRIHESSVGYVPHHMDPKAIAREFAADPTLRADVEKVLSRQFQRLNTYTYKDAKTGEVIEKAFDKKFSDALAKDYLNGAIERGKGSYTIPMNIHDPNGADIIRDIVASRADLDNATKEAILGRYSRGGAAFTKGRLRLDLSASVGKNGKKLGDLFVHDIRRLTTQYSRKMAGEVAMAQRGVYGKKGADMLRKVMVHQGASNKELEAYDQIVAEILNTPFASAKYHPNLGTLRSIVSAVRLGGMAFTQIGEYGNAITALGVSGAFKSLMSAPRMAKEIHALVKGKISGNKILGSLEPELGGYGIDDYVTSGLFRIDPTDVDLYGDQSLGMISQLARGSANAVHVVSGARMLTAIQTRGMAEQIVRKAVSYISKGIESKALDDMGITPSLRAAIKLNLPKIAKFGRFGELRELNPYNGLSMEHIAQLREAVERGAHQIIQRTYAGELGKWAHNDVVKTLLQFRTFGITAVEKQWGRYNRLYGAGGAALALVGAMSWAVPIHLARMQWMLATQVPESEREKFIAERMSPLALTRATLNYASAAGLLGDIMDMFSSVSGNMGLISEETARQISGGGTGRQSTSGLVPSVGLVDDFIDATANADSGRDVAKLGKLLPGANHPAVAPFVAAFQPPKN